MSGVRKNIGIAVLAFSVCYSAIDLLGWVRPPLLRMRAHGGWERTAALVVSALAFKALILAAGALLAFWPDRSSFNAR